MLKCDDIYVVASECIFTINRNKLTSYLNQLSTHTYTSDMKKLCVFVIILSDKDFSSCVQMFDIGMVAALTSLPIIGVPVKTAAMSGIDSLYSIVQMPKGIPVATVAIGNAANAGLLAVRMLATQDPELHRKMEEYMMNQEKEVIQKAELLEKSGYASYLNKK